MDEGERLRMGVEGGEVGEKWTMERCEKTESVWLMEE